MKLNKNQFRLLLVVCLIVIVLVTYLSYMKIISFIFLPITYAIIYLLIEAIKKANKK